MKCHIYIAYSVFIDLDILCCRHNNKASEV